MQEKEAFMKDCALVARKCKGSSCMAWVGKKEGECAMVANKEMSLNIIPEKEEVKQDAQDVKEETTFTNLGDDNDNDYAKV